MNEASHKLLELARAVRTESSKILAEAEGSSEYPTLLASLASSVDFLEEQAASLGPKTSAKERLDALVALANVFDESRDTVLMKYAAVLDDIILEEGLKKKEAQYSKYNFPEGFNQLKERLEKEKVQKPAANDWEAIDKIRHTDRTQERENNYGGAYKKQVDFERHPEKVKKQYEEQVLNYRPLQMPLSTRTCPDHPGAQMMRVADNTYQCSLDHRIYPWQQGFVTYKGNVVPGGDLANQIKDWDSGVGHYLFQTRESKLTSASDISSPFTKKANEVTPEQASKAWEDLKPGIKGVDNVQTKIDIVQKFLDQNKGEGHRINLDIASVDDSDKELEEESLSMEQYVYLTNTGKEVLKEGETEEKFPDTPAIRAMEDHGWKMSLEGLIDILNDNKPKDYPEYNEAKITEELNGRREDDPFFTFGPNPDEGEKESSETRAKKDRDAEEGVW